MKLMAMALVCLLLVGMWPCHVVGPEPLDSTISCCYSFVERKIPMKIIRCGRETSSSCLDKAVIFHLKKGNKTCGLKKHAWVREYLEKVSHMTKRPGC
uniref:Chemokine interleukin-8-like domain-containing protein n=1 Tax=Otolemur garnettii TaxID=30611 RepID=H0WNP4_OTOGA